MTKLTLLFITCLVFAGWAYNLFILNGEESKKKLCRVDEFERYR